MITNSSRFQEALERTKGLQLEAVIRKLSADESRRRASPKQIVQRQSTLFRQITDASVARRQLERILQGNDLTDITYLSRGLLCARSVCRIVIRRNRTTVGYGTGFLVAPGVLMTNHHVFSEIADVPESIAQFGYERDLQGEELTPAEFRLRVAPEPILFRDLDMALVAVEPRSITGETLENYSWLKLNPQPGKAFVGEYLTIIQHPKGERKQVCVRENKLLMYSENGPFIWYQTDTVGGSSGSPVFNNSWDVVALHHSSVPKTMRIRGKDVWLAKNGQQWRPEMGDDQIDWIANEGIRVSRILQYLADQHRNHPLAEAIVAAEEPRSNESLPNGDRNGKFSVHTDGNGNTRILIPVEIGIKLGLSGNANGSASLAPKQEFKAPSLPRSDSVRVVEAVVVDQTNYNERNG